ncbi:MAG: hypothetical protein RR150_10815, partial [Clostridia bacterium]
TYTPAPAEPIQETKAHDEDFDPFAVEEIQTKLYTLAIRCTTDDFARLERYLDVEDYLYRVEGVGEGDV